jgi:hypothetical protein
MITAFEAIQSLVSGNLSGRSDGSEINYLDGQIPPTDSEIQAELTRLQAEYDSQEYARLRRSEYDKLNQFEMRYDDLKNGTSTWEDAIDAIKLQFPKGGV